jgi:hypothetical protein
MGKKTSGLMVGITDWVDRYLTFLWPQGSNLEAGSRLWALGFGQNQKSMHLNWLQ